MTGEKITYHTGVWLKKKQYIAGFSTGTAPKAKASSNTGRPTAETINQYFFLPLNGWIDMTNSSDAFKTPGTQGYFMSKTSKSYGSQSAFLHVLNVTGTGAAIAGLNWTPNNICSVNIWTAD